jgi:adenylate cyclase class 2
MEEIEVKFLNVDVKALEVKLAAIGASKSFERIYRRKVYDFPDLRLNAQSAWVRVRDEGDQVTMGFKQRKNVQKSDGTSNDGGMDELEIVVSDFGQAAALLEKIGLVEKFYEENHRTRWVKGDIEFNIDHWPMLKPFLEIEAPTWEEINVAIDLLKLDPADKKIFSTNQVYRLEGINELDYKILTFDQIIKRNP